MTTVQKSNGTVLYKFIACKLANWALYSHYLSSKTQTVDSMCPRVANAFFKINRADGAESAYLPSISAKIECSTPNFDLISIPWKLPIVSIYLLAISKDLYANLDTAIDPDLDW